MLSKRSQEAKRAAWMDCWCAEIAFPQLRRLERDGAVALPAAERGDVGFAGFPVAENGKCLIEVCSAGRALVCRQRMRDRLLETIGSRGAQMVQISKEEVLCISKKNLAVLHEVLIQIDEHRANSLAAKSF